MSRSERIRIITEDIRGLRTENGLDEGAESDTGRNMTPPQRTAVYKP